MNINGAGALNANKYKSISIGKHVNVKGQASKDNLVVSDVFTKSLKGMSDQEKREEILKYFIRNHTITLIKEDEKNIVFRSECGIEFTLNRYSTVSNNVLREVLDKYNRDRMETYAKSDVDFYWFRSLSPKSMEYSVEGISEYENAFHNFPEEFIDMTGMKIYAREVEYKKDEKVITDVHPNEIEFFKKLLDDCEDITFYRDMWKFGFFDKRIFKCIRNGRVIYVVIDIYANTYLNIISEYIKEERDCMRLQYKMEGF